MNSSTLLTRLRVFYRNTFHTDKEVIVNKIELKVGVIVLSILSIYIIDSQKNTNEDRIQNARP